MTPSLATSIPFLTRIINKIQENALFVNEMKELCCGFDEASHETSVRISLAAGADDSGNNATAGKRTARGCVYRIDYGAMKDCTDAMTRGKIRVEQSDLIFFRPAFEGVLV